MKKSFLIIGFYFLLLNFLQAQEQYITLKTVKELKPEIKTQVKGVLVFGEKDRFFQAWRDKTGEFVFVHSQEKKENLVHFYAFNIENNKQLWGFSEKIEGEIRFFPNAFQVMDIDNDGEAEVFFSYKKAAKNPKIFDFCLNLVSKKQNHKVIGQYNNGNIDKEYGLEFKKAPIAFRGMAEQTLKDFSPKGPKFNLSILQHGINFFVVAYLDTQQKDKKTVKLLSLTAENMPSPKNMEAAQWVDVHKYQILYTAPKGLYIYDTYTQEDKIIYEKENLGDVSNICQSPSGKRFAFAKLGVIHVLELDGYEVISAKEYKVNIKYSNPEKPTLSPIKFIKEDQIEYQEMDYKDFEDLGKNILWLQ